ncbi:hydrolase [Deminuibacter soli]|uniref:Hydrolase n=1 Tax=Deminuibacter soli TaxID=2291815 RepID=A0A3E1NM75_9BACT|nr:hydrolase [Deminuibacter soli]RFM29007.1 hydrolase [Deminuibacter soli]
MKLTLALAAVLLFTTCACNQHTTRTNTTDTGSNPAATRTATPAAAGFSESFETGTKNSYAEGTINLSTGSWHFTDALLGNLHTDVKNGSQSARIRSNGKLSMQFDYTGSAGTVTIAHARFGSDGNSSWQLWYSTNGGSSYTQAGSTITTAGNGLQTARFPLHTSGTLRLEIRKTDGSNSRLNIDDITINGTGQGDSTTTPPPPPPPSSGSGKKFLFDATKAETAGNADWVIDEDGSPQRVPTPAQNTVTSATAETYWTGALSSWGIALAKAGHTVETLPAGTAITYGNSSNPQDLSNYDVFVIDEPNTLFTASEKTAILNFVNHGGGLFMIADHNISDRNNDGHDSPNIWNDLMTNNSVQNNPFGFSIDLTNISELSTNVLTGNSTNPLLHGSQGNVTKLEFNNGSTITINPSANAAVQGLVWQGGYAQNNTHIMCASSAFGTGRVFVVTDSSPIDDGTGAQGNHLYVAWPLYSHTQLFMNASLWLAKLQ